MTKESEMLLKEYERLESDIKDLRRVLAGFEKDFVVLDSLIGEMREWLEDKADDWESSDSVYKKYALKMSKAQIKGERIRYSIIFCMNELADWECESEMFKNRLRGRKEKEGATMEWSVAGDLEKVKDEIVKDVMEKVKGGYEDGERGFRSDEETV